MSVYKEFNDKVSKEKIMRNKLLCVDGVVAVGKSTLLNILEKELGYIGYREPVVDNPILDRFYYDKSRWSFPLQLFFLNKRFAFLKEIMKQDKNSVIDRAIYLDQVFAKMLADSGDMTKEEYELYRELALNMAEHIQAPTLMIYLRCNVDTACERIKKRGRVYEQADVVPRSYWESLNKEYEAYFKEYSLSPLLVIDVDDLDFENNPKDREYVLNLIKDKLDEIEANEKKLKEVKVDTIKCPYCNSINVEAVDTIASETTEEEGYDLSSYDCMNCEEYFYVESFLNTYHREVRKEKYAR